MATFEAESLGSIEDEAALFQSKISILSKGILQALPEFATKALAKNLITSSNCRDAQNSQKGDYERAVELLQIFLDRIKVNKEDFYVILKILQSIPALEQMVKVLQPSHYSTDSGSGSAPQQALSSSSGSAPQQALSSSSGSAPQQALSSYSSSSGNISSLDPDVCMDLEQQLEINFEIIKDQYACYVTHLCERIIAKGTSVNLVKLQLKYLLNSNELKKVDTIIDIFDLLNEKTSFLNYHIFESLRNSFIPDEDSKFFNYPKNLKAYVNKHRISEFLKINPELKKYYDSTSDQKLFLKFDIDATSKMARVLDLHKSLAKILEVRPSTLQLIGIEGGCVIVTFSIPAHMANSVFPHGILLTPKQVKQLQDISVKWMQFGNDKRVEILVTSDEYHKDSAQQFISGNMESKDKSPDDTTNLEAHCETGGQVKSTDQLSDKMLLETVSGGRALQGVLLTNRLEDQLEDRSTLLEVPENVMITRASLYEENTISFSSAHVEECYKQAIGILGFSAVASAGSPVYGNVTIGMDTAASHKRAGEMMHAYSSTIKHCTVKLACYSFEESDLKLHNDASMQLKMISRMVQVHGGDSTNVMEACIKFFHKYGSHVNRGPLTFGGNFFYICSSKDFSQKDTEVLERMRKDATAGVTIAGCDGPFTEMSFDKIKESYQGKCSTDALVSTQSQVKINGGPPEATDLAQWRAGLVANNSSTWALIDRGNKLIAVWDIIRKSHMKELGEVGEVLRNAWEKMTGLKAEKDLQAISYDPEKVLDEVSQWKVQTMTPQEIKDNLDYLLEVKRANPSIWIHEYLLKSSLQSFLESIVDSDQKLSLYEHVKFSMQQLVEEEELSKLNTRDFPGIEQVSKWLYNSSKQRDTVDFKSFDTFLEKILKDEKFTDACDSHSKPLEGSKTSHERIAAEVSKAIHNLRSHCQHTYNDVLITILVHPFQSEINDSDIVLKPIEPSELQKLRLLFLEQKKFFDQYLKTQRSPLNLQAYLFMLAVDIHISETDYEDSQFEQLLLQIKRDMTSILKQPLEQKLVELLNAHLHGSNYMEVKQQLLSLTRNHADSDSLKKALKTIASKHEASGEDQTSIFKKNPAVYNLLARIGLSEKYPKKLQLQDALCIRSEPLKLSLTKDPIDEKQLSYLILHKIMACDCQCRSDFNPLLIPQCSTQTKSKTKWDAFDDDDSSNGIHPVDSLLALILCSDDFLRQDLFSRLAKCQLSIPLILPDPFTKQLTIPLWAMRSIIKEWKCIDEANKTVLHTHPIVNYGMPIVSFIRFGKRQKQDSSKSKILNDVIGETHHDHFFHHDYPGGQYNCLLGDGLVDMCWYLPEGKPGEVYRNPITFLNLHGDAKHHPQQTRFLSRISSMCFILLTPDATKSYKQVIENLKTFPSSPDGIVVLAEKKPEALLKKFPNLELINLNRTAAQIKENVENQFKKYLDGKKFQTIEHAVRNYKPQELSEGSQKHHSFKTSKKYAGTGAIIVDESSDFHKHALTIADEVIQRVLVKDCAKENTVPLQGDKLWKAWATNDKEFYRQAQRGNKTVSKYTSNVDVKKAEIRRKQLKHVRSLTPMMELFIVSLLELGRSPLRNHFLNCLKLRLNDLSREKMSKLRNQYHCIREELRKLEEHEAEEKSDIVIEQQEKLNDVQEDIINSSFGLEHLFRELGQVYEAALHSRNYGDDLSRLPKAAAELLIDGWPLEVMDGDAAHVPLKWITSVLKKAVQILKNPKVFVLSVLGIQSTGKSTMLNTVFGLQFNVSAGRCTRGVFMQLLPLDEELRGQTKCSYVLVVDTEGLRAPALDQLLARKHDNELATFVIGLANMTLINIYGEVPGDMDDILQTSVHAFLRMKEVKCNPSCQFIYQNAVASLKSEVGTSTFLKKLNSLTVDAAKEEQCKGKYECFNDVIKFDDQSDVHHFPGLWKGDPPMAPVNQGYSNAAQTVKQHFINTLCKRASKSSAGGLVLSSLCEQLRDLWTSLLKENFVFSFKNILEIIAYKSLESEYSKWEWKFREGMLNWERKAGNEITTADLQAIQSLVQSKRKSLHNESQKLYGPLESEMEAFFNGNQSEMLVQWKALFQYRLENLSSELERHAETHCITLGESRLTISKFEREKTHYIGIVTNQVQDHIADIKKNQEKLNENLDEGKLEEAQLQRILEKELFTPENLEKYTNQRIIGEVHVIAINEVIQQCGGQLTASCLNDILVGGILETEQVKTILRMGRQTEKELKVKFDEIWTDLIDRLGIVPRQSTDVEATVESTLTDHHSMQRHKGILIERLKQKSLNQRGASFEVSPEESVKTGPSKWIAQIKGALSRTAVGVDKPNPTHEMTNIVFSEVRKYLQQTKTDQDFNKLFVQEILCLVDDTIERNTTDSEVNLTTEYKIELYLTVCGYVLPKFKKMNESFEERNDPKVYLEKSTKGVLFTRFKNQYYQTAAEEAIANTLCASLDEPIRTQVEKRMGAIMVGQMKSSEQYFSSKMALKAKVLADLHDENDFESYVEYLLDIKKCLEERIKHYTVKYCDYVVSGTSTRLQIAVKFEIARLIKVVENTVSEVDETDIQGWLSAFCKNTAFRSELGANLEVENLSSDSDIKHEPNLMNLKQEIRTGLTELEKKLCTSFGNIECERGMINWQNKPHELLRNSIGCTEQCPFCGEQCDLLDDQHINSGRKHMTKIHRASCLASYRLIATQVMVTDFCPTLVSSDSKFRNKKTDEKLHPYKDYISIYPHWSIPPDPTAEDSLYWKWFVANYKEDIAKKFSAKPPSVPEEWSEITWEEVEDHLESMYKV